MTEAVEWRRVQAEIVHAPDLRYEEVADVVGPLRVGERQHRPRLQDEAGKLSILLCRLDHRSLEDHRLQLVRQQQPRQK